jgi:hypothetical protein
MNKRLAKATERLAKAGIVEQDLLPGAIPNGKTGPLDVTKRLLIPPKREKERIVEKLVRHDGHVFEAVFINGVKVQEIQIR